MTTPTEQLLDEDTVSDYVRGRGLETVAASSATRLAGGVSNVVLAVAFDDREYVVKQSLAQLAVADEWLAPIGRVITEAEALVLLHSILPTSAPIVYDQDESRHTITLQRAPEGWVDWKVLLMAGQIEPAVAERLGSLAGQLHLHTLDSIELGPRLDDYEAFELLRIDPYYRTVGRRAPEFAGLIADLINEMQARRMCLVHGDFSPKNMLVSPPPSWKTAVDAGLWVIDFEVAHRGDPIFDVAFMCSHLLMKPVALPQFSADLDRCLNVFLDAYAAAVSPDKSARLWLDPAYLGHHIGALLLARVRGKSPSGYLSPSGESVVWKLGESLLTKPISTISDLFARRNESL